MWFGRNSSSQQPRTPNLFPNFVGTLKMRRIYDYSTMQTKASFSRAVLALSLVWRGATSYTKLGPVIATHFRAVIRAGKTGQRCFPRTRNAVGILKSCTGGGNCHEQRIGKNVSSRPPAEGGSSRRNFLRQLVGSSVAVFSYSSVVGAAGATASAADSVPDGETSVVVYLVYKKAGFCDIWHM